MPKRSSKKRPRDPNALAAEIVAEATGEEPKADTEEAEEARETKPEAADKAKNPHAQALGRLGGKKGGKARAAKLTAKRRREIARIAARARWKKTD
jgi:hypothetical protein